MLLDPQHTRNCAAGPGSSRFGACARIAHSEPQRLAFQLCAILQIEADVPH
jgi:hypothetical protein